MSASQIGRYRRAVARFPFYLLLDLSVKLGKNLSWDSLAVQTLKLANIPVLIDFAGYRMDADLLPF